MRPGSVFLRLLGLLRLLVLLNRRGLLGGRRCGL